MGSHDKGKVRGSRFIRTHDVVWLLLFSAMAAVSAGRSSAEILLLSCLALFQVLQPRYHALTTGRGNIAAILLKLLLGYLLILSTGGLQSSYYLILLLPVVSAATSLGVLGTAVLTALACASYVSFLAYIDWTRYFITLDEIRELSLRLMFLGVVGYLTHTLAEANRVEAKRYQAAAAQLSEANANLRKAEAAMRRSERLAALGQLTAGLAHELRNPLGTIKVSAEALTSQVARENEIAHELAGFISTEVDRTSSLITRFLDFARPLQLRRAVADITEVIDRAVTQIERHSPPFRLTIYKNYSPDVLPFSLDAELMERVIYNLLLNAAQATPEGGAFTVKTRQLNSLIEISVIDRGHGIAPAHMENIFNPFFTTKPDGIGLGLAIVSKIVDEHGGKLTVESETGKGSVFCVVLPLKSAG